MFKRIDCLAAVVLLLTTFDSGVFAQSPQSAAMARQLTAALAARHLDAIAAKDPSEPDRFVAALFFPNSQLLVVSARYAAPIALDSKLSQKAYRDIYLDLQGSAIPNSSLFFQDMKADGLCAGRDQAPDILYDGAPAPKIFDGDWEKHRLSRQAYAEQLEKADLQYSRLLQVLVAQLNAQS